MCETIEHQMASIDSRPGIVVVVQNCSNCGKRALRSWGYFLPQVAPGPEHVLNLDGSSQSRFDAVLIAEDPLLYV